MPHPVLLQAMWYCTGPINLYQVCTPNHSPCKNVIQIIEWILIFIKYIMTTSTKHCIEYLRRGKRKGHHIPITLVMRVVLVIMIFFAVLVSFHTSAFSTLPHSVFITIKIEQDTGISIDTRVEYL